MDGSLSYLGLTTMTHNFFYRAGARTIGDVVLMIHENTKGIPEKCVKEARAAVQMQEHVLGVRLLNEV